MNTKSSSDRPIIITGCPRSGTTLTARIIGSAPGTFLMTEARDKKKHVPEEETLLNANQLLALPEDTEKGIYDLLRGGKRLVLKNPEYLFHIDRLKRIFPDAQFVYCLRNPYHVLASILKGNMSGERVKAVHSYIPKTFARSDDLFLESARLWSFAIEKLQGDWHVVRFEDLEEKPRETIVALYQHLGLSGYERALLLPQKRERNLYLLRTFLKRSKYKEEIMKLLEDGCRKFGYSPEMPDTSLFDYQMTRVKRRLRRLGL